MTTIGEFYDELYAKNPAPFRLEPDDFVGLLPKLLRAGSVIDLGCGYGRNALYLAGGNQFAVTAIDASQEGIRQLIQCAKDRHLSITAKCADISQYRFLRQYNACISTYVLHHLSQKDATKLIKRMRVHTLRGGYNCVIAFMNEGDLFDASNQDNFFPAKDELAQKYKGWKILRYTEERVQCRPDETGVKRFNKAAFLLARRRV